MLTGCISYNCFIDFLSPVTNKCNTEIQADMGISLGVLNTAISLTGLFSGMFVVAAGGISDRIGKRESKLLV